MLYCINITEIW